MGIIISLILLLTTAFGKEAMFYKKLDEKIIQCKLCFRECVIKEGKRGFCRVRENRDGRLYSLVYARPSAVHIDPVEKEPQYHFLPGSSILCIGTVGCNFSCRHCHNWHLSQASFGDVPIYKLSPEDVGELALKHKVPTISFTYNEPTVCYEYLYDVARHAKKKGLKIIWHTNGALQEEPLRKLLKYTDAVTVDLKGFSNEAYKNSSALLPPVLKTLKIIKEEGVWLEIVNLVIPTINDASEQIRNMCAWIRDNLGADTPLHFSRFFPAYRLTTISPTPISKLEEAYRIAKEEGLNYVSVGNVPGHEYNSTFCPNCKKRIIWRIHFAVLKNDIVDGRCRFCDLSIPGVWK